MVKAELHGNKVNQELLQAAVKFNAIVLGIVSGVLAALAIFLVTHISLSKWGDDAGNYLNLLGVFLPGYSASSSGAWIGAFWSFVFVGLAGFLTYWLYGRLLGERLAGGPDALEVTADPIFKPVVLRLYGWSLGIAVGFAVGGALFISTAWLVVRGTAAESYNAQLLSNYLPGYSPSILGGLIGAVELFLAVFLGCLLLAAVYNKVVDIRYGKAQ